MQTITAVTENDTANERTCTTLHELPRVQVERTESMSDIFWCAIIIGAAISYGAVALCLQINSDIKKLTHEVWELRKDVQELRKDGETDGET